MKSLQLLRCGLLISCSFLTSTHWAVAAETLDFEIKEGNTENYFLRQGPIAAHVVVTSGTKPRILFAFPAGNTGAGLWFSESTDTVSLMKVGAIVPLEEGQLRGVQITFAASNGKLELQSSLLTNIRGIRDYIFNGLSTIPAELVPRAQLTQSLALEHISVDQNHRMVIEILPLGKTTVTATGERFVFRNLDAKVSFRISALTDEPPLSPFKRNELFNDKVAQDERLQNVFGFLSSKEKLLAGSWRFLTYFGRDTLISLQLLMPVLQPAVIEAALGSVLERLGPEGQVAHEEGIGEFAAHVQWKKTNHAKAGVAHAASLAPNEEAREAPALDYKMIDGEFLLPPALAAYLLDRPDAIKRAHDFLQKANPSGITYRELVRRNFRFVVAQATPFADSPTYGNLIGLKPGYPIGNWRDSSKGLGGGRYPYDVNAVLVPAALNAIARVIDAGLLGDEVELSRKVKDLGTAWRQAADFFVVSVPKAVAMHDVRTYAASLNLDAEEAAKSIQAAVQFHAVSLDADGRPVPIMNTDEGFALFFADPSPEALDAAAQLILAPFPAGLRTQVGLVVANPVFAPAAVKDRCTQNDYHGTVVWSWQQALMAAGLERQLARMDLPAVTRNRLSAAQAILWQDILRLRDQSAGELWSWKALNGRIELVPYGQTAAHVDESNAAQLWSTVYLAVRPPCHDSWRYRVPNAHAATRSPIRVLRDLGEDPNDLIP